MAKWAASKRLRKFTQSEGGTRKFLHSNLREKSQGSIDKIRKRGCVGSVFRASAYPFKRTKKKKKKEPKSKLFQTKQSKAKVVVTASCRCTVTACSCFTPFRPLILRVQKKISRRTWYFSCREEDSVVFSVSLYKILTVNAHRLVQSFQSQSCSLSNSLPPPVIPSIC